MRLCFAETSHQKYTNKSCQLCPVEFFVVRVALVTTTRGSSECWPDGEAEATSRFVVLCGAKQKPQTLRGRTETKLSTTLAHSALQVPYLPVSASFGSESCFGKKSGAVPALTYLARAAVQCNRASPWPLYLPTRLSHTRPPLCNPAPL